MKPLITNIDCGNSCIPGRHRLLGQTTMQQLSSFEPWKLENINISEGWGLALVANKKNKCMLMQISFKAPFYKVVVTTNSYIDIGHVLVPVGNKFNA